MCRNIDLAKVRFPMMAQMSAQEFLPRAFRGRSSFSVVMASDQVLVKYVRMVRVHGSQPLARTDDMSTTAEQ